MGPPSFRSPLVPLLRGVILAELVAFVGLALWPCEPVPLSAERAATSPCVGRAVVEPLHLHTVSLEVKDWSQGFMYDHGVGPLLQPVLLSTGDQLTKRLNLDRAYLLARPHEEEQILEHLAGQRIKHLTGVSQLLPLELARRYEQGFFTTWDRAWSVLDLPERAGAPLSLIERVPAPLEGP